jgi:hypothetical protein
MSKETLPVKGDDLNDLAAKINDWHRQCVRAAGSALEYAKHAGDLLLEAKAQVDHGGWLPWLQIHFEGSEWTARNYMRVASNWDRITDAKSGMIPDLTYSQALRLLAAPPKDDGDEPEDDGAPSPEEVVRLAREAGLWPDEPPPALPPLRPGHSYTAADDSERLLEIVVTRHRPNPYYYVAVYFLADDPAAVEYLRRPVSAAGLPYALGRHRFTPAAGWREEPHEEEPWYVRADWKP